MCTLMYGLSAAPESQPRNAPASQMRNAVMVQAITGSVSLASMYIPERILPAWLRTAAGPAFAIGSMVKLVVVGTSANQGSQSNKQAQANGQHTIHTVHSKFVCG